MKTWNLGLTFLIVLMSTSFAGAANLNEFVVESTGSYGGFQASVQVGTDNIPHILYSYGGILHYGKFNQETSGFDVESLGVYSTWASMTLDSNNNAHIGYSYLDSTNHYINYMYETGSSWSTPLSVLQFTRPSNSNSEQGTNIILDDNNNPYISYAFHTSDYNRLGYVSNTGSGWTNTTVVQNDDQKLRVEHAMGIDSDGNVHFAYATMNTNPSKVLYKVNGSAPETVASGASYYTLYGDIEFDSSGRPVLLYEEASSYAYVHTRLSSSWSGSKINTSISNPYNSTEFDYMNGQYHMVAYNYSGTFGIRYKTNSTLQVLDDFNPDAMDIAVTPEGNPVIIYADRDEGVRVFMDENIEFKVLETPVPEPATIFLICTAIFGLGYRKIKKS